MVEADKRIPVTEDTHKLLHDLKTPGQTYDELMVELVHERNRKELAEKFRRMDEMDTQEFVPLDEA
jgi:predicted CopG family antitoxin